ncbi:MAG: DUF4012 domain-containing protein [Caldilineaceae bacterium]|nr:DUF4012 domain-containing protein [Caldilineaceae bacterium]
MSRSTHFESKARTARPFRRLLIVISALLLLLILFWGVRTSLYGYRAYRSAQALQVLVQPDFDINDLPKVQTALNQLATATAGLDDQITPLAPVLGRLTFLPGIGPSLAAGPELLRAGRELTAFGYDGVVALTPALNEQGSAATLDGLLAAIAASSDELNELRPAAEDAAAALVNLPIDQLPAGLAGEVAALQNVSELLPAALDMSPMLPELLGFERPVTYLILVQNNQELRSTGGFISGVGTLTLENGEPTQLNFQDSYNIFDENNEYAWAPEPMRRYMGIELLLLRDANWSPDFPQTAELASTLFTQDTGLEVDGVISIDLRAVQLIVEALGQIQVEGASQAITGANIEDQIKLFFEQPVPNDQTATESWWLQRKDFMPRLAEATLTRIESGNVNYASLMVKGLEALHEGAIQVWVKDDAETMTALAASGWDGGLHPVDGADFLFYSDTNVGYNKVDSVMERSLDYVVVWPDGADGRATATVTMTYRHPIDVPGHVCDPTPRYGDTYDDMSARCYFDYVRLYVPGGSTFIEAEGLEADSIKAARGEAGAQRFSGYFEMLPGSEHTVTFTYQLPATVTLDNYRLALVRQSGTGPLPVTLQAGDQALTTTVSARRMLWEPGE